MLYLHLYHGRKTINEELNDWGALGPIIACDSISFTYDCLYLNNNSGDRYELNRVDDTIEFEGVFYGDFVIYDTVHNNSKEIIPVSSLVEKDELFTINIYNVFKEDKLVKSFNGQSSDIQALKFVHNQSSQSSSWQIKHEGLRVEIINENTGEKSYWDDRKDGIL